MNYNDLREIVNKHDPVFFIKVGAPEDEYDLETGRIFVALQNKNMDEDELTEVIKKIFIEAIDEGVVNEYNIEIYKNLAHEILTEWNR